MRFPREDPAPGGGTIKGPGGQGSFAKQFIKKPARTHVFLRHPAADPPSQTGTGDLSQRHRPVPPPNCLAKAAAKERILKNNRIDYMMK
jgi:hypothetical protein